VSDKERKIYGFIPLMASFTYGQIGALNAESFCERVLSLVLTEGNTLLDDAELEMLIILRMNRDFMEFMRKYSPTWCARSPTSTHIGFE